MAAMAGKEGAKLGKVVRRDSIGCDYECAGALYRLEWKAMDVHIAEGTFEYPGKMEPGVEFVFTFKPTR